MKPAVIVSLDQTRHGDSAHPVIAASLDSLNEASRARDSAKMRRLTIESKKIR
jgi:hypothetical protein